MTKSVNQFFIVQGLLVPVCLAVAIVMPVRMVSAKTLELVLNNPTAPPFTTPAHDGLLDIIVGEAFRRTGLRLSLVKLPAERGLIYANAGINAGDLSRIAGIEKVYPNLVRVPEKIFDMDFVAFTRVNQIKQINWQVLQSYSVGYVKGWKIFEQNLRPKTEVTTASTPEQLMNMLVLGRIQFVLYSRWMGLAIAKRMGIKDIRVVEPALAQRAMYIYLNKHYAVYVSALAKALRDIKREGMYTRICRQKLSVIAPPTAQCRVP
jgi:polar amino acid transport system substrate-binding protein